MPDAQIVNPNGAFGVTALRSKVWSQTAPVKTSAAVVAKRLVAIGTTGLVATAATNGTPSLVLGAVNDAIASGDTGLVVVGGMAEDMPADGAIAAGDILKRSVNTAGYVQATATPAAGEAIGVAINASAASTVDVWIAKSLALS